MYIWCNFLKVENIRFYSSFNTCNFKYIGSINNLILSNKVCLICLCNVQDSWEKISLEWCPQIKQKHKNVYMMYVPLLNHVNGQDQSPAINPHLPHHLPSRHSCSRGSPYCDHRAQTSPSACAPPAGQGCGWSDWRPWQIVTVLRKNKTTYLISIQFSFILNLTVHPFLHQPKQRYAKFV